MSSSTKDSRTLFYSGSHPIISHNPTRHPFPISLDSTLKALPTITRPSTSSSAPSTNALSTPSLTPASSRLSSSTPPSLPTPASSVSQWINSTTASSLSSTPSTPSIPSTASPLTTSVPDSASSSPPSLLPPPKKTAAAPSPTMSLWISRETLTSPTPRGTLFGKSARKERPRFSQHLRFSSGFPWTAIHR
ncbi:hypothetical protein OIU77_030288 [Salix suchowensis]|uniref:Uncharacterized protein n=1 Tax=Salix suchowensis TaxID=1278906 RepID=A0ABQ9BBR0_9ROSI|nr:hypothetical protein OIU77_030288 [Salix suchowensis]